MTAALLSLGHLIKTTLRVSTHKDMTLLAIKLILSSKLILILHPVRRVHPLLSLMMVALSSPGYPLGKMRLVGTVSTHKSIMLLVLWLAMSF
jgi:hypothetical protein